MSQDDQDKVGYKRPPKHGQFKPGQSGNPKGRPKKQRPSGVSLDVSAILGAPVSVVENGQRVMMPPKLIELKRLMADTAKGDPKAAIRLARQFLKYDAISASDAHESVLVLPTTTMPFAMSLMMARRFGRPPWTSKQIRAGRQTYFATRTEEQKRLDDAMGYADL